MEKNKNKANWVTIPNFLSLFRFCLIPVILWLLCEKQNNHWAGGLLLLSGLTDVADGFIARRFHMVSDLGKILDPIADKLTQGAVLICLILRYPLMGYPLVLMVLKEVFMGISGLWIIRRKGIVPGADWHGKAATVLLYGTMFLHVFWRNVPLVLSQCSIFSCCILILLSFMLYALRNIRILRKEKGAPYER